MLDLKVFSIFILDRFKASGQFSTYEHLGIELTLQSRDAKCLELQYPLVG